MSDNEEILTKDERIKLFVQSLAAIEEAIEPFKEQLKELKVEFKSNRWLTDEELKNAIMAYRLIKKGTDMSTLNEMYDKVSKGKMRGNAKDMFLDE